MGKSLFIAVLFMLCPKFQIGPGGSPMRVHVFYFYGYIIEDLFTYYGYFRCFECIRGGWWVFIILSGV